MNDYISTRDAHQSVSSKQAILNGMSPDGGLYVLPTLDQIHLDLSLIWKMQFIFFHIFLQTIQRKN